MEILGTVRSISSKTNLIVNLYVGKISKIWKGGFQCLYTPIMLIDSTWRKDENYYP